MNTQIKIKFSSIDGIRKTRTFKHLEAARQFALSVVGEQDVEGGHYAVSCDGVVKIEWSGCSRAELFAFVEARHVELNKVTTFYAKGDRLFCREAGYTHDHQGQLFGIVIEVMDRVTGDHFAGWSLRHIDATPLFDEDHVYATREAALAAAKAAKLAFINYLENDCA